MAARTERLGKSVEGLVASIGGGWTLALSMAMYIGFGLAVPLALSLPWYLVALVNFSAVVWALVFLLIWFGGQIRDGHRRSLLEWTSDIHRLSATQFEWLVGEVFRREGWDVVERGGMDGPDGNVDLELTKGSARRLVQVKRWTAMPVGIKLLREFSGTLTENRLEPRDGVFVTLSTFMPEAVRFATSQGITLVDRRELLDRIEGVRSVEPCPICERPMRLDRSAYGYWFHCVSGSCRGKLDLGTTPGEAARLLNQPPG